MAIEGAVWEAMCPPVRERYEREGGGRLRGLIVRALAWEVRRRGVEARQSVAIDARLLVVQPDHLGGVIASTPAIRLIKETLPTAEITALVGPWGADAAEHCPAVDRVRICRFPAFDRALRRTGRLAHVQARLTPLIRAAETSRALRRERFDAAIVLVPDYWSAAVTALAAIPVRVGLSGDGAARFLTHGVDHAAPSVGKVAAPVEIEHVAAVQLRAAHQLLGLTERRPTSAFASHTSYEPTISDRADAVRLWRQHELDRAAGIAVIHPTPGAAAKRWPAERFAIIADHLSGRLGATVVLTGGPDDVADVRRIAALCVRRPIDLAGQTSFGALAALLDRARLALGPDNGAMHLATARGVPTLRLFGPTDARVWGGWIGDDPEMHKQAISRALTSPRACSPCHRLDLPDWRVVPGAAGDVYPCLSDLTVESVIEVVERLWREADGR